MYTRKDKHTKYQYISYIYKFYYIPPLGTINKIRLRIAGPFCLSIAWRKRTTWFDKNVKAFLGPRRGSRRPSSMAEWSEHSPSGHHHSKGLRQVAGLCHFWTVSKLCPERFRPRREDVRPPNGCNEGRYSRPHIPHCLPAEIVRQQKQPGLAPASS